MGLMGSIGLIGSIGSMGSIGSIDRGATWLLFSKISFMKYYLKSQNSSHILIGSGFINLCTQRVKMIKMVADCHS